MSWVTIGVPSGGEAGVTEEITAFANAMIFDGVMAPAFDPADGRPR